MKVKAQRGERERAARATGQGSAPRRRVLPAGGVVASRFVDSLQAAQAELTTREAALARVDEAAERLKASPTLAHLYEYRRAVSELLRGLIRDAFRVSSEVGIVRRGRQKLYTLVRAVDKELEELARLIVARERDRMAIVAKLDVLRGLLLDLYQ